MKSQFKAVDLQGSASVGVGGNRGQEELGKLCVQKHPWLLKDDFWVRFPVELLFIYNLPQTQSTPSVPGTFCRPYHGTLMTWEGHNCHHDLTDEEMGAGSPALGLTSNRAHPPVPESWACHYYTRSPRASITVGSAKLQAPRLAWKEKARAWLLPARNLSA